jgi:hypothetical protein
MAYPQFSTGLGPSGPGSVGASGTVTLSGSAQIVCQLRPRAGAVHYYAILLDGTNVATAALSVQIQAYNSTTGLWIIPNSFIFYSFQESNPLSIATGASFGVTLHGPFDGIGLFLPTGGTATGTFTGIITAL